MHQNPTTQIRLQTANQQKHTGIKTAFNPLVVACHELAGLAFVAGKFKLNDKHWFVSPINKYVSRQVLSLRFATAKQANLSRARPVHHV